MGKKKKLGKREEENTTERIERWDKQWYKRLINVKCTSVIIVLVYLKYLALLGL